MRAFIKDLSSEWKYMRSNPLNMYSLRTKKYILRSCIIIVNKEISLMVLQLITTPLSLLIVLGSILIALFLMSAVGVSDVTHFLEVIQGFIISFISTLVAAAIFISTLHRQFSNKTMENEANFSSAIVKHKNTMKSIFKKYKASLGLEEKISLFKAAACDSVFDPTDYESFKSWHLTNRSFLIDLNLSYNNYLKYPYDSAQSVNWNRAGFLAEGCKTAQTIFEREDASQAMQTSVKELLTACQMHSSTTDRSFRSYVPVEFVGKRLYRVVVYSLFSTSLILIAITFSNYNRDIFPNINFNTVNSTATFALIASFLSVYLILRYVFMFISYLRNSTATHPYMISGVYVYEPDVNMRNTNGLG